MPSELYQTINEVGPQIFEQIDRSRRPLFVCHKFPDGDALGSCLGFSHIVSRGKTFCPTPPAANFSYLPKFYELKSSPGFFLDYNPDLIVTFDSSDLRYCGIEELIPRLFQKPILINIDHHESNQYFGDINLVSSDLSSACELIYFLLTLLKKNFSASAATCFLSGVVSDTGIFFNPATNQESFVIAGKLIRAGAQSNLVIRSFLQSKSVSLLRFWGEILLRLKRDPLGRWATTVIFQNDLEKFDLTPEDAEGVVNFLNIISDAKIVFILKERPPKVKVSIRTTQDEINVAPFAELFGGGGHAKAAGFEISGKIAEIGEMWRII